MRRREQVVRIVEMLRDLWGDLAVEAAVSTFSTLCNDKQLNTLRENLENDLKLRAIVSQKYNLDSTPSKQMTVAESEK